MLRGDSVTDRRTFILSVAGSILIPSRAAEAQQAGKAYRIGYLSAPTRASVEQGLQAFQAAQLRGIKSKLLYLPNENHWVLHAQNAIAWQREFFSWLAETLK